MTAWTANIVSAMACSGSRVRAARDASIVAAYGPAGAMPQASAATRRRSDLRMASDEIGTCMAVSRCAESFPFRTARSMPMRATPGRPPIEAAARRRVSAHLLQFVPTLLHLCQFGSAVRCSCRRARARRSKRRVLALPCIRTPPAPIAPDRTLFTRSVEDDHLPSITRRHVREHINGWPPRFVGHRVTPAMPRPYPALSCFATLRPPLSPNATHVDHPRCVARIAATCAIGRCALRGKPRIAVACDLREWLRTGPGSPPCRPGHVLAAVRPQ